MNRVIGKISVALLLFTSLFTYGQTDKCEISLMASIPEQTDGLYSGAEGQLKTKLKSIVAANGLGSSDGYAQFAITPEFNVVEKNILPGPPRSFVLDLEMNLFIGDSFGQKVFASTSVNLKGVGESETKAYINAFKKLNAKNKDVVAFIEDSKKKIIAYYDGNYTTIIKKAESLANQKNFEEAMFLLTAIPECSKGYDAGMKAAEKVYQLYVDHACMENFNKAKAAWNAQQDAYGAHEAGQYLVTIFPESKCYSAAIALQREMKAQVKADLDFEIKMYNDAVSLEQQRIEAWKAVGTAFAKRKGDTYVVLRR
ncbi:hypothetical protein HX091_15055 [Myroides odoratimimus]|uniref:hypothetical protein n=1 Tax=Myroides odoratimimus TaxID=76832 RepID=UPI0025767741|nr:hypothetical protein [Myroides odoratimimus]MDM1527240.1 hypothetical protein [Myroides odoratimimus]